MTIVIVCGSRKWTNRALLESRLDRLLDQHPDLVIRHGACPTGADRMADTWARRRGVRVERFKAEWWKFGHAAGPIRNVEMAQADPRADLCLAFWMGPTPGTSGMLEEAEREGIPTEKVSDV